MLAVVVTLFSNVLFLNPAHSQTGNNSSSDSDPKFDVDSIPGGPLERWISEGKKQG